MLTEAQVDDHIMGVIFAHQFTIKKGLKKIGDRAEEATTKELKQIHDMGTYQPMDTTKLTQKGNKWRHYLPTEKRGGRVKSRRCAIGSKKTKK